MPKKRQLLTIASLALACAAMAQAPAFPGAEGFGRYTTGGRGGEVIHVTNLNDSGTGSFRQAVSGSDRKIVVFDVGGTIELSSDITIGANTTILGQTAPGMGVTLRYYTINYGGDNIIVRFIRFRRGEERNVNDGADATWTRHHRNIILDHCSFSWSIDEVASFYDNRDFTMQWCTVAEALNNAGHDKGAHGYGGIWGGKGASFHHNFLAHLNNRSPRFNGARYAWEGYDKDVYDNTVMAERVDFRNCLIYNWGTGGCYGGPGGGFINMVNNYYKYGPGTTHRNRVTECSTSSSGNSDSDHPEMYGLKSRYYINGNYVYGYGANYDWQGVTYDNGSSTFSDPYGYYGQGEGATISVRLDEPSDSGIVTTHDAETAFEKVRLYAGASLTPDLQDLRYAEEALNGTATYKGSVTGRAGILDVVADQGPYVLDTATRPETFDEDGDGIADLWERRNGLDPTDPTDATAYTLDPARYYTNIEVYANSLVQDIMLSGNADALYPVEEYYPAYTTTTGTVVEAINLPDNLPQTGDGLTQIASGTITWELSSGDIETGVASADIADYITVGDMTMGSNLALNGSRSINGARLSNVNSTDRESVASSSNAVTFNFATASGIYFTPTKVSFNIARVGTDSGVFDAVWTAAGNRTELTTGTDMNRNNEAGGWYTAYNYDFANAAGNTGDHSLAVYIYNVNAGRQSAIGSVVIEGTVSQTSTGISDVTTDAESVAVSYFNLQGQRLAAPGKGAYIKVTTHADGKKTVRKVMGK